MLLGKRKEIVISLVFISFIQNWLERFAAALPSSLRLTVLISQSWSLLSSPLSNWQSFDHDDPSVYKVSKESIINITQLF